MSDDYSIADDRLEGLNAIRIFVGDDNISKTYRAIKVGVIPAARSGNLWIASKRAIRERYEHLTRQVYAPQPSPSLVRELLPAVKPTLRRRGCPRATFPRIDPAPLAAQEGD